MGNEIEFYRCCAEAILLVVREDAVIRKEMESAEKNHFRFRFNG